jgi:hypothetical protein
MRPAWAWGLLLALATPASAGGVLAPAGRLAAAPFRYLGERGLDLLDVFELNVAAGSGAKLSLRYGVQFLGLGDSRSWRIGTLDRRVGMWRELDSEIALWPLSYLAWPASSGARLCGWERLAEDIRFVAEAGSEGVQHLDRKELNGDVGFAELDTASGYRHTRWGDSFPIGVEFQAGLGARAMVRPLQLADFLVGFVGFDLDPWLRRTPRDEARNAEK